MLCYERVWIVGISKGCGIQLAVSLRAIVFFANEPAVPGEKLTRGSTRY